MEVNFEAFKQDEALSIPEVDYSLDEIQENIKKYVTNFNGFKSKEDYLKVKKELLNYNLNNYEITCILNFLPGTLEEAIALIPSLKNSLKKQELNEIIDLLNKQNYSFLYFNTKLNRPGSSFTHSPGGSILRVGFKISLNFNFNFLNSFIISFLL